MQDTLIYVTNAPYFWQTMGMTSACAMFIGAIIYNGDLKHLAKGLITLIPYISLLLTLNYVRITDKLSVQPPEYVKEHFSTAYAGIVTIGFLTLFYIVGLIIGVVITKQAHKGHHERKGRSVYC